MFGPHPRDYDKKLPRKIKRLALLSSLSSRASDGDIVVIKALDFDEPKTSRFVGLLRGVDVADKKVLVVADNPSEATVKSAQNIPGVALIRAEMVNAYHVMWADKIMFTEGAISKMEEVFVS